MLDLVLQAGFGIFYMLPCRIRMDAGAACASGMFVAANKRAYYLP